MKTIRHLFAFFAVVCAGIAAPGHKENLAGPNGGRLITSVTPHAEFFITADRKVRITFVGEDGKPVGPAAQVVTVTAGERSAPTRLAFKRDGDALVSDGVLPEGNDYPTVVVIKAAPDEKNVYARFNLNFAVCGGCQRAEYACTCGH